MPAHVAAATRNSFPVDLEGVRIVKYRSIVRGVAHAAVALAFVAPSLAAQQKCPAVTPGATMPLTYSGGPTVAAITPCDLMTRLYIYAADSMRGREAGTPDAIRATAYIEREVRRLGLKPAGDNGTYFQNMPVTARVVSTASTLDRGRQDVQSARTSSSRGANADRKVHGDVVFGGTLGDTTNALSADDVRGKIVVVMAPARRRWAWRIRRTRRRSRRQQSARRRRGDRHREPDAHAAALSVHAERHGAERRARRVCRGESVGGRAWWPRWTRWLGGGGNAAQRHRDARASRRRCSASRSIARRAATRAARRRSTSRSRPCRRRRATSSASCRARIPSSRSEYVVIGAHSDHVGLSSATPDRRARFAQGLQHRGARRGRGHAQRRAADRRAVGAHQRDQGFAAQDLSGARRTRSATAPTTTARARCRFSRSPKRSRKAR